MKKYKILIAFALIALMIQCVCGVVIYQIVPTETARGTFGNMFGAISTLFTGITLAGLIYTIHQQQKDLISAKEETKRIIIAQENSAEAPTKRGDRITLSLISANGLLRNLRLS